MLNYVFIKLLTNFLNKCSIVSYSDEIQLVHNNTRIILNNCNNMLRVVLQANIEDNVITVDECKQINK